MTGFGSSTARFAGPGGVSVEVKGVNQRFLDLKVALPKEYAPWEGDLRKLVQAKVARGRIEVYVTRNLPGEARVAIDRDLAAAYLDEWRKLKKSLRLPGEIDVSFLKGLTDLYRSRDPVAHPEAEIPAVRTALVKALEELDRARSREGKHLERDMRARVKRLESLAVSMAERARQSLENTRCRVEERMRELLEGKADPSRIVQEAAFLAERSDVTEEIVRLQSHLAGLRDLLGAAEPVGKRIEFLLQEVQREVNTVASKSSDLALTHGAVEAKGEVEKIREQVQNVE
jgi:uncharacterized protein (TIGR00255 family)